VAVEDIVIKMEVVGEEGLQQALKIAGLSMSQFNKHLQTNALMMTKQNVVIDKLTGKQMVLGNVLRQNMVQTRRFKMEWLSIMFAGMALQRAFGGLLKTQLQLWGVTEGFSSMMSIVMGPIMEKITPILWRLIEVFMELPYEVQLAIGAFVILAAVLGTILMVVGQVFLGLMGFKLLLEGKGLIGIFKLLGTKVMALAPIIGSVIAVLAGVILIIKGIFMVVKGKFEGIGLIIMGIGAILLLFIGWWALIPIAVGAAVYLIIKHWDKVKAFFGRVWQKIKDIFWASWNWIKGMFLKYTLIGDIIKNWEKIKNFFKKIWEGIKYIFKNAMNFIIKGMNLWIRGIETMINSAIKGLNALIRLINKVPGVNIRTIGKISLPKIPTFQTGGLITQTGPAFLHRGERVLPKNRAGGSEIVFSPTVYISSTINNEMDIRLLATRLNEFWVRDFERIAQTRGI